jgi:alcohol dehydrogenase class IV
MSGIDRIWQIIDATGLEMQLSALRIPESALPSLAAAGLAVTRLMKNNLRPMTQQDAESIYRDAFYGLHRA